MTTFTYTLQSDFPMLLGTAGRLAQLAHCYPDTTGTLEMGTRRANLKHPLQVMTMGVRKGDRIIVRADGPSETELTEVLWDFFDCAM